MGANSKDKILVYLAGKVPKGDDDEILRGWRDEYIRILSKNAALSFLSPENESIDENDPAAVVGHDLLLLKSAKLIIVNASHKLGVGTAQEMVFAKLYNKPVLTVLPQNSHHRRTEIVMNGVLVHDWIHPFIYVSSDEIFTSIQELSEFLTLENIQSLLDVSKGIEEFERAISHYERVVE